ncbi:hypothetical protein ACFL0C_01880 [Patescibacteria group bacterium]
MIKNIINQKRLVVSTALVVLLILFSTIGFGVYFFIALIFWSIFYYSVQTSSHVIHKGITRFIFIYVVLVIFSFILIGKSGNEIVSNSKVDYSDFEEVK